MSPRRLSICVLLTLALASGCGTEKPAPLPEAETTEPVGVDQTRLPPPPTKPDAAPVLPEPTTPEEIDQARKQAMIDGRDKDVIKYCELAKVDPANKKTDPQVLLGCALASCRLNDPDRAKVYAKPLPKVLKDQAIKICLASNVAL